VADTLGGLSSKVLRLIAGVVLFGDPQFNPTLQGDESTYDRSRYGVLSAAVGARTNYPSSLSGHVFSFCHMNDPICQLDLLGITLHFKKATASQYYGKLTLFMVKHRLLEHKNYPADAASAAVDLWGLVHS
jgi:hypothetical protein